MVQEDKNLSNLKIESDYNTEDNNIVQDFYAPCLGQSTLYERAVGYFRANIYRELGEDLLNFAMEGGKVFLICSPDIPESDEETARNGYDSRDSRPKDEIEVSLLSILRIMAQDPKEADCLNMLKLLIENKSMELLVATRPGGIYHRKVGVFYDANGNYVSFSGSANETERAISPIEDWSNDEEFDVYRSWGAQFEVDKALKKSLYLKRLLDGGTKNTTVRPLNEVERQEIEKFRSHQSFEDCRPGARKRSPSNQSREIKPHYYQQQAIDAWSNNSHEGILSMPTGTGKTFTALFAISKFIKEGRSILILVPSTILLNQWYKHTHNFYPDVPIMLVGGGNNWKKNPMKHIFTSHMSKPRITIAVMNSAASDDFIEYYSKLNDPMLVVDEIHRIGSPTHRRILEQILFKERLGLSATPERLFDSEGDEVIKKFFGSEPVYHLPIDGKVKLSDADPKEYPILGHFLCRYKYYFDVVHLDAEEQEEWERLSKEIGRKIGRNPSVITDDGLDIRGDNHLQMLFINRSRILKNASEKIISANRVIKNRYSKESRWIIYCEDEKQLNSVAQILRNNNPNTSVLTYYSDKRDESKQMTLDYLEKEPCIIVSIKCLDEGVDIPLVDGALILASSTNPRQYIQRRGRVLRKAKDKPYATIVDTIVLPAISDEDKAYSPIVKSELARAWKFAKNAENNEITHELWKIARLYDVDLTNDMQVALNENGSEE